MPFGAKSLPSALAPGAPCTHDPFTRPAAVCLVSGGMDSAVVLAEAVARGFDAHALSFRYGQRHEVELAAAARVASAQGATTTTGGSPSTSRRSAARPGPTPSTFRRTARTSRSVKGSPSPTSPRATRSFSRWPSAGPRPAYRSLRGRERGGLLRLPGLPARVPAGLREPGGASPPPRARRAARASPCTLP